MILTISFLISLEIHVILFYHLDLKIKDTSKFLQLSLHIQIQVSRHFFKNYVITERFVEYHSKKIDFIDCVFLYVISLKVLHVQKF